MIKLPDTDGLQERVRVGEQSGPGPRLRAAREACGFEIIDIAKQLRLHPNIIEDLEHDTFPEHLALVFVRGYLRSYATLINLNPDQIVKEFNALGYQEDRDLPDLKGKPQAKTRMRNQEGMDKSPITPGVKWGAIIAITVALGGIFIAYTREPVEQLSALPPVISDSTDPSAQTTTDTTIENTTATPAPTPVAAKPQTPAANAPVVATPTPAPAPSNQRDDDTDADNEPQLPRPASNRG